MEHPYYFIFLALIAEILGTVGGFGSSLFFVPIAAYFLDFYSVLGVTALFHVSSNLTKIALFRNGVDKRLIFFIGIPGVIFVIIGAYLSAFIPIKLLELSLAIFLVTLSSGFLLFRNLAVKPDRLNAAVGGLLSGFVAGLLGTGGAIRGIVLAAFNLKMEAFIATSAFIDLAIDISRSIVYAGNGYIHKDDLYLIPILFLVSILGTLTGKKILSFVSEKSFRLFVLTLILATGLITLFRSVELSWF